jgi:hypothetical protein
LKQRIPNFTSSTGRTPLLDLDGASGAAQAVLCRRPGGLRGNGWAEIGGVAAREVGGHRGVLQGPDRLI